MIEGLLALAMCMSPADSPGYARAPFVDPPEYYNIPLVATRQVVGTGRATGVAGTTFGSSPFGVSLAPDGSYNLTLHVQVDGLPDRARGEFVAWATTPSIEEITRIGVLDESGAVSGPVEWNKFIVVVTLEPEGATAGGTDGSTGSGTDGSTGSGTGAGSATEGTAASARGGGPPDQWTGPIVLRGMSRSGMMHTMAGHGPFEQQECAAFGY